MSTQTKHWSQLQERGTYLGIVLLLWVYRIFGRTIVQIVLYPVVCYMYLTGGKGKQASEQYRAIIAKRLSDNSYLGFGAGVKHYYQFATTIFDKLDAWLGNINDHNLIYQNASPILQLLEQKKGAIFIGSHLGNLEVCRALSRNRKNAKFNVLVFTHHAVEFNRVLTKINPESTVNLIQVDQVGADLAILLKEKIDNGEFIVIAGDRTSVNASGRTELIDFLGAPAPFSQGPFILSSLMDCPVYWLFCFKEPNNQYRLIFEHVADSLKFPRKIRQQALLQTMTDYAQRLSYYCEQYPYQWFNFFDFWQADDQVQRQNQVVRSEQ